MLLVVIITFFILNAPFFVVGFIKALKYEVDLWVEYSTMMILMLNYVNNPVIYGLINRKFKKAVSKLFCKAKRVSKVMQIQEIEQKANVDA